MKACKILLIFWMGFGIPWSQVLAQSVYDPDSLRQVLARQSDEARFKTLDALFDYYLHNNLDSAKYYANLLQSEVENASVKYKALAQKNLAMYFLEKKALKKSENYMFRAIELERRGGLQKEAAESYRMLAGIYFEKNDLKNAIDYLYKSLKIFDLQGDYRGMVACYNNIGLIHNYNRNFRQAVDIYKKCLQIIRKHLTGYSPISPYTNLGIAYRNLKKFDSSYYYTRKALDEALRIRDEKTLSDNYLNIAKLFTETGQNDSAAYYFDKNIRLCRQKFPLRLSTSLGAKGKWYYMNRQYDSAIAILNQSLEIGKKENNLVNQQYALYYLYKSYQQKKQYPEAIRALEDFVDVQDSLHLTEALVKINRIKAQYEDEKKNLRIAQLEKVKALDRKIRFLLFSVIFLILISSGLIIRHLIVQRRHNRAERKRIEAELHQKHKQLTSQALMMMQKNKMLNEILQLISELKNIGKTNQRELAEIRRKLKRSMHSENDWELFRQYFEMVNKDFFRKLKAINSKLTPSELKLAALTKLHFNIKEAATLLNISPDSVKTVRHNLRKKLGLKRQENLYDFLNSI